MVGPATGVPGGSAAHGLKKHRRQGSVEELCNKLYL